MNWIKLLSLFLISTTLVLAETKSEEKVKLPEVELSGFFRTRYWVAASKGAVPGKISKPGNYRNFQYGDALLRNQADFVFNENVRFVVMTDLYKSATSNPTTLYFNTLYGSWNVGNGLMVKVGRLPVSLPGGYLLEEYFKLGANLSYDFGKAKVAAGAYEHSDNHDAESPKYGAHEVYLLRSSFMPLEKWENEAYYVFERDGYTYDKDTRKAKLHWFGLHSGFSSEYWELKTAGVFNLGDHTDVGNPTDAENPVVETSVKAALWNLEVGGKMGLFGLSYQHTGATGNTLDEKDEGNFQTIAPYHSFSDLGLGDIGGVRLLGSNQWSGMTGHALRFKVLLGEFKLTSALVHYRALTTPEGGGNGVFGNEVNFGANWKVGEYGEFFTSHGLFKPDDLALAKLQSESRDLLYEGCLGFKVVY